MKMKTTKFLAVLAVLAFAFAVFAVAIPAEQDDAAATTATWDNDKKVLTDGETTKVVKDYTDKIEPGNAYYISENVVITFPTITQNSSAVLLLIEQGCQVDIKITAKPTAAMYISAMSVKKTTSGTSNIYTSPVAAGNNFVEGTALKLDTPFTESGNGSSFGIGTAANVGEICRFYALDEGIALMDIDGDLNVTSQNMILKGETSANVVNYYHAGESTWKLIDFTGTVKTSEDATPVNQIIFTKFNGEIKIDASTKVAKITKWTSGDVDVVIAGTAVKIGADIPAGCTLYIDGDAQVETDTTISHTDTKRTDGTIFYNDGTISVKQDGTYYGKFTVKCAKGMVNNGSINNLGYFDQNNTALINNGKITTGYDAADKVYWNSGDTGAITNNGTFTFKETTAAATTVKFAQASTGDIVNKNENVVYLTGVVENNNTFGVNQTVIVTGNTTIKGMNIINGAFIVDEDATLTIVAGGSIVLNSVQATLTNNGNIVVQSATPVQNAAAVAGILAGATITVGNANVTGAGFIQNNGTITLTDPAGSTGKTFSVGSAAVAFLKNARTIINSQGTMEIGANASFMNLKGAAFFENSYLSLGSDVSNAGAMSFDGKVTLTANATITIADKSATITIVSISLPANFKLTIKNGVTSIELTTTLVNDDPQVLSGLVIETYNIPGTDKKDNYGYFIIEGNVSYYTSSYSESVMPYLIQMNGKTVIGDLTVQKNVTFRGNGTNEFVFVGEATFVDSESAKLTYLETVTVTGEVVVNKAQLSVKTGGEQSTTYGTINAAMYMVNVGFDKVYYYTTLENAVADAAEAGVTEVIATGEISVKGDLEIPAGLKVVNKATPLTIADGASVTVKDGAELNNLGEITVNGALYAEDATDITGNTTDSKIVSDVKVVGEPDVLYTNLYDALAVAEAGDVVVLTKNGEVTLAKNTTIKEGVTLDTNEKDLSTYIPATQTTKEKHYTLTVDGIMTLYGGATFKDFKDVVLNGYILSDRELTYTTTGVPGAYFYDEEDDVYCIAGVKNLGDILEGGIATVGVWGDVKTSSLSFEGTAANATVTFNNNVDVDAIIADNVKIVFKAGDVIDTAITEGENILGLTGIVSTTKDMTVTIGDSFAVAGDLGTGADVPAKDFVFNIVGAIKVSGSAYAAVIVGEATTSGNFEVTTTIDILGSLVASKAVTAKDMSVIGTVSTTGDDGKITIANGLNIGSLTEIIGAGADVEGAVTAKSIILFVGNTIDEKIVAEMKSTEVYVDGELWFTVYSDSAVTIDKKKELVVPVEDALAVEGKYEGLEVDKNGILSGTVTPGTPAEIDIEVTYEIYSVVILTDAGVKSVSIDGIELWNSGTNKFELPTGVKLMAGTHAVTFTMKAGYSGTPTLKTVDGTILKDNKFVTSGTEDLTVNLQLNGTEPTPEPEPTPTPEEKSEWTITTILLVILVILIAVMAVIVALRLNRN